MYFLSKTIQRCSVFSSWTSHTPLLSSCGSPQAKNGEPDGTGLSKPVNVMVIKVSRSWQHIIDPTWSTGSKSVIVTPKNDFLSLFKANSMIFDYVWVHLLFCQKSIMCSTRPKTRLMYGRTLERPHWILLFSYINDYSPGDSTNIRNKEK